MIAKFAAPTVAPLAESFDFFVTVSNKGDENFTETEVFAGDDPIEMVTRAAKFVLSDLGAGDDNTYRLFDDDGNHVSTICIHTLHTIATEWGVDMDAAMRELVALRF